MEPIERVALTRARNALSVALGDADPDSGFLSARYLKAKALNPLSGAQGFVDAQRWAGGQTIKAAIGATDRTDINGGEALAQVLADFADIARPMSLLGRLPGLKLSPFGLKTLARTAGSVAGFHGEGEAIPVSGLTWARVPTLQPYFVSALDVLTLEALRCSSWLDRFLLQALAADLAAAIDAAMLDPTNAGGAAPAAITYNAPATNATGDARADIGALFSLYGGSWADAVLILHPRTAAGMAGAITDWGDTALGVQGGRVLGVPAICTEGAPLDSSGGLVTLLDVGALRVALDVTELGASTEGTIEMDTAPASSSVTPTEATAVSLFQTNAAALKATAAVDWRLVRADSVACLSGADYSGVSP